MNEFCQSRDWLLVLPPGFWMRSEKPSKETQLSPFTGRPEGRPLQRIRFFLEVRALRGTRLAFPRRNPRSQTRGAPFAFPRLNWFGPPRGRDFSFRVLPQPFSTDREENS